MVRAVKSKGKQVEWVGALVTMPTFVMEGPEPIRPEMLLWLCPQEGTIVGSTIDQPGTLLPKAAQCLRDTIKKPLIGPAKPPTHLRVASQELADRLRPEFPTIEVVCAETPEIDAFVNLMSEHLNQSVDEDDELCSFFGASIDPEVTASVFRSAAKLFRCAPWTIVPSDQDIITVTIEALDIRQGVISVIGRAKEDFGFILFPGCAEFDSFLDAFSRTVPAGQPREALWKFMSLTFDKGSETAPVIRKEIAKHGWEVASNRAFPTALVMDSDRVSRPPTVRELAVLEAIANALPLFVAKKKEVRAAWRTETLYEQEYQVPTHSGEVTVRFRIPRESRPAPVTAPPRRQPSPVGRKLSEVILDFAGPMTAEAISMPDRADRIFQFVISVWNAYILANPPFSDPTVLDDLSSHVYSPGVPPVLAELFHSLCDRKASIFANDYRIVDRWWLEPSPEGPRLLCESSEPRKSPARKTTPKNTSPRKKK